MKNALGLFNDILFLNHRPWKFGKQSDTKFKQLISEVKKEYYSIQPNYKIDFIKPLSNIRKYYNVLIEYEAIRYLNGLHLDISEALNKNEKSYIVNFALTKTLSQKIKETAQVIQGKNYSPEQFDLSNQNKLTNRSQSDESYILHLLKHQLMRLIMEVQDSYTDLLKDEPLTQEEIYYKYFYETAPEKPYIIDCENIVIPIKQRKVKEEMLFKPILRDLKPIMKSKADYKIILKPTLFGDIESRLYEYGIIDLEYYFIKNKKQSNNTLLAAVYQTLIQNNYFRRNIIGTHKKYTDLAICQYLDERYSTDTSQQFRRLTKAQIKAAKIKLLWLDNIKPIY